jgi:hypothetical protein
MRCNAQRDVLEEGHCASKGRVNEKNGVVKQLPAPENERIFEAKIVKRHISDSFLGTGGGVVKDLQTGKR